MEHFFSIWVLLFFWLRQSRQLFGGATVFVDGAYLIREKVVLQKFKPNCAVSFIYQLARRRGIVFVFYENDIRVLFVLHEEITGIHFVRHSI